MYRVGHVLDTVRPRNDRHTNCSCSVAFTGATNSHSRASTETFARVTTKSWRRRNQVAHTTMASHPQPATRGYSLRATLQTYCLFSQAPRNPYGNIIIIYIHHLFVPPTQISIFCSSMMQQMIYSIC